MATKIRNLRAEEIECRVSNIGEKGITLLLYKNARVDQAILDETFGIFGWERRHNLIGNELYCVVSIWDEEKKQWVYKEDVGTESYTEKAKGAASDSFKRACFNLGIGRELYTAPFIFIPRYLVQVYEKNGKQYVRDTFSVRTITISEEKTITALEIMNQKGESVYSFKTANNEAVQVLSEQPETAHNQTEPKRADGPNPLLKGELQSRRSSDKGVQGLSESDKEALYTELRRTGVAERKILDRYGLDSLDAMDAATYRRALAGLRRTKAAA